MDMTMSDEAKGALVAMLTTSFQKGGESVFDGLEYAANATEGSVMSVQLLRELREHWLNVVVPKAVSRLESIIDSEIPTENEE